MTQIALGLGAEPRDLDALQYHPNGGAWPETMQGYSIPETTRAYGAVLLNADGEEFTDSLGPRDVVSQAIFDEVAKGKGVESPDGRPAVYLDPHPGGRRRHLAAVHAPPLPLGGIDPLSEPILTYPVLHYQNGGLVIDEHGETTVPGLFACGEIAGGTHGRNRMMGNSLLEVPSSGGGRGEQPRRGPHDRHRSPEGGRGRSRAPLRVGAEGHPAGSATRSPTQPAARRTRPASACSTRSSRTSRWPKSA